MPHIPDKPEKQEVGLIGEPIIFNRTEEPDKKLTLKDVFPEKETKKKKKRGKKKKKVEKKPVPIVRPDWVNYDFLKANKDKYERQYATEFTSLTHKQYELALMKDSTIPPLIDVNKDDPKKREIDLLIDSAINS